MPPSPAVLARRLLTALLVLLLPPLAVADGGTVRFLNWSDYIDHGVLDAFEAETGIRVEYQVYDSRDELEAVLLGDTLTADLVVLADDLLATAVARGRLQALDPARLPHRRHLDPTLLAHTARFDPDNRHALPYLWGTTGLIYNPMLVSERLSGPPPESLQLLFDPAVVGRLADCGVYLPDSASTVIPLALRYHGQAGDLDDPPAADRAAPLLRAIRPHLGGFASEEALQALASGRACLALGWSDGVALAREAAAEQGIAIDYGLPREGVLLWFDLLAIPATAAHPDEAYALLNHLLRPAMSARTGNLLGIATANRDARALVDPALLADPAVYPPADRQSALFTLPPLSAATTAALERVWSALKTGTPVAP